MMKQPGKKRALASAMLGFLAVLFACGRVPWLAFFALPLGILAVWRGIAALASVARSHPSAPRRGIVPAILGTCLGSLAILLSLAFLVGRAVSDKIRPTWQPNRFGQIPEAIPRPLRAETVATNFTSNLPIIVLHSAGQEVTSEGQPLMRAQFFEVDAGTRRASVEGTTAHDGQTIKLADYKGKNVVLWFYPKADTPG